MKTFTSLIGYKDSEKYINLCQTKINEIRAKAKKNEIIAMAVTLIVIAVLVISMLLCLFKV